MKLSNIFRVVLRRIRSIIASRPRYLSIRDYGDGNQVKQDKSSLKKCVIEFYGNENHIAFGKNSNVSDLKIVILGSNNEITIGDNVDIGSGKIWLAEKEGKIRIGADTTISGVELTITEPSLSIAIGEDCLLSWGIDIRCGDGHPIIDIDSGRKLNSARSIKIGNHVWVGHHASVLKGVSIGDHAVIGAGATVTKDVPGNCVAVGAPAKVVRENITWQRENKFD